MSIWTETLFPDGRLLVYHSSLNDKLFATQWSALAASPPEGLIEVESFLEIDTAVLGQGGSPVRQRTRLLCTTAFEPIRYQSQSGDKRWSLAFEQDEIVVHPPGGEADQRLPRAGAEYLLGMTGHQAIIMAVLHAQGRLDDASLIVFAPDPLLAVPYRLSPAPDLAGDGHWVRSSHEEDLLVDPEGVLRECRLPKKGVRTTFVDPPPPLPKWARDDSIARPNLKYARPADARFQSLEVTIEGPVTPIGATLTIPEGDGPFPAVLFLGGSGTHDRHGIAGEIDIGTHEIVDHLAGRGFAGLRYDTRGAGTTGFGKDALSMGLSALVQDARSCFEFLRQRPEVDRERIFLVGHSQGGTLALALVARHGVTSRGVVLLAALGRTVDEVMSDQLESQGPLIGLSADQIANQREELRTFVELARSDRPSGPGSLPDHLMGLVRSRAWLREHLDNPATELIAHVRCPVLVLQGEKDFQVSLDRDARRLIEAGRAAGVDAEIVSFPDLDHLFKRTEGESRMAQYYDRSRKVSSEFLAVLDRWLITHL